MLVTICTDCGHRHSDENHGRIGELGNCPTCGCTSVKRHDAQDQNMVRIEGKDLELLLKMLDRKDIRYVRFSWRGDAMAVKVNEGSWTHGLGRMQPPY